MCIAASGQRQVVLRGGGGNGHFSKHVLGSASAIVATFAVITIKNRSRIVSTIIQLRSYAESQCAACTGTAIMAVSTATDACANATTGSASTTGCCNSTTVYIDCSVCTGTGITAISTAADACATAGILCTITAGCRNSAAVYVDRSTSLNTAALITKAAAADACATAGILCTITAGCRNSTAVYVDCAACAATYSAGNTISADACATAAIRISTIIACSGKCARAGALCVDVKRCTCRCDARACCKLRTITKNKVYCTADRNTTADGKTTFRYNIPRTVSPAGSGRFKFGCVHGLRGSVPVNIADAGGIRRQAHAGEKP